jgi:hypothetical protein
MGIFDSKFWYMVHTTSRIVIPFLGKNKGRTKATVISGTFAYIQKLARLSLSHVNTYGDMEMYVIRITGSGSIHGSVCVAMSTITVPMPTVTLAICALQQLFSTSEVG